MQKQEHTIFELWCADVLAISKENMTAETFESFGDEVDNKMISRMLFDGYFVDKCTPTEMSNTITAKLQPILQTDF